MRKLYFSPGSPYARKVRIVLAEKRLDYEGEDSQLYRSFAELSPVNPNLQVPVFEEDGLRLFESNTGTREALRKRGHVVEESEVPHGGGQAIYIDGESGVLQAASDPRKDGCAMGF